MGTKLAAIFSALMLGFIAGYGIGVRQAPAPPLPPAVKTAPDPERESLRTQLDQARRDLEASRAVPEGAPAKSAKATPSRPAESGVPDVPVEWIGELRNVIRVKDLLQLKVPAGADSSQRFHALIAQARELLKQESSQATFLADFPYLSPQELTRLWDVFWLSDREKGGGFGVFGTPFARRLSETLLQQISVQTDSQTSTQLACMLAPDVSALSDAELAAFRTLLGPAKDPVTRRLLASLPDRGPR